MGAAVGRTDRPAPAGAGADRAAGRRVLQRRPVEVPGWQVPEAITVSLTGDIDA